MDDPSAHLPPTPAQAADFAAARAADIGRQRTDAEVRTAEGATAAGRATSDAAVQKRREREERRAAKRQARAADDGEGVLLGGDNEAGAETAAAVTLARPDTPLTTAATSAGAPYTVSIPASSSSLAWYDPAAATDRAPATHTTLASARAAGIWTYPSDAADRARCAVFRDLWEKHYFMGGGIKFGGDWLVYPGASAISLPLPLVAYPYADAHRPDAGDPLRYHSHFVAQTLTDAPLRPMEIVAHGRLGTATKKAHLLCAWDGERGGAEGPDGAGTVEYWSVEWAGFG